MTLRRCLAVVLLSVAAAGCGDDSAKSDSGNAGNAGAPGGAGTTFCAALAVIRDKCQRCHQSPPQHGAPVPFLTYEDTQAPYYTTNQTWSDVMIGAVTRGGMPDVTQNEPPISLMPQVEPLSAVEKARLLDWLEQGARPEGGTDCPQ